MKLAVLFDPKEGDELAGPRFVVDTLLRRTNDPESQGQALRGVLLLGDKRLLPLLEDTWSKLSETARLELTRARSGFVYEGVVEFWLRCLEKGCSESVFGAVVAAIAKLPAITDIPYVVDVRRVFPAYKDSENPLRAIRQTTFADYLDEIRPRLEALEARESEPKMIPKIYEIWADPESLRRLNEAL